MKYGMLIEDLRKSARLPLHAVAACIGVSRHTLREVELGTSPPFTRSFNDRLLDYLQPDPAVRARIERSWRAEQCANMTPRALGHGKPPEKPVAKPAPVKRAKPETPVASHVFNGPLGEARTRALNTLRRVDPSTPVTIVVTIDDEVA